ncbi:MAG: class 1b ribonucleoside-diphosphate reductase subunit beta [Spirochaetia bacterium]
MNAINWNNVGDLDKLFWDQNVRQFWVDEEIPLSNDKLVWAKLSEAEKVAYQKVLGGLTFLDTQQGSVGMPMISMHVNNMYAKSILSFMGTMEHMHAKSYSSIFMTVCSTSEIDDLFDWVDNDPFLVEKLNIILSYYKNISDDKSLYLAMICSVLLETFLFYSGFFYPLFLAGKGQMVNSGEIINLIIRDESIHGVYVGLKAQELFATFSPTLQGQLKSQVNALFKMLYDLEVEYTSSIYDSIELTSSVVTFIQYNANKAFANFGLDLPYPDFKESQVNPIVLNGLDTRTKLHDFFSTKGNGYVKAMKVEELTDDDFL